MKKVITPLVTLGVIGLAVFALTKLVKVEFVTEDEDEDDQDITVPA